MSFKGHIAEGTVTGTGSAINVQTGWSPSFVHIVNETSGDEIVWFSNMTSGHARKRVAAGTSTKITTGGISPYAGSEGANAPGFTIGTDADINVAAEVLHYVAISTDA